MVYAYSQFTIKQRFMLTLMLVPFAFIPKQPVDQHLTLVIVLVFQFLFIVAVSIGLCNHFQNITSRWQYGSYFSDIKHCFKPFTREPRVNLESTRGKHEVRCIIFFIYYKDNNDIDTFSHHIHFPCKQSHCNILLIIFCNFYILIE